MWTFQCYYSGADPDPWADCPDPWADWYAQQDAKVRANHDSALQFLCSRRQHEWRLPNARMLKGGDRLCEIRITGKVQHRIIGYFAAETTFIIVMICTHKDDIYKPKDALKTARKRKRQVETGEARAITCEQP